MESYGGVDKKLIKAGEYLATPADEKKEQVLKRLDQELEEAVLLGAPRQRFKAEQYERNGLEDFRLYHENFEVYELFTNALGTQRRYLSGTSKSIFIGLDYNGVLAYLDRFYPKKKAKRLFEDLQLIERGMINKQYDE